MNTEILKEDMGENYLHWGLGDVWNKNATTLVTPAADLWVPKIPLPNSFYFNMFLNFSVIK